MKWLRQHFSSDVQLDRSYFPYFLPIFHKECGSVICYECA